MEDDINKRLRQWACWAAFTLVLFGCLSIIAFFAWILFATPDYFVSFVRERMRVVVGVPMAALMAFCVVVILQATSGKIRFKGLGFEFEGASGPVVLWVMTFLAIAAGMRALW